MTAKEIRHSFLEFFRSKQHKIVPSAPIVNKDDPTLMFTNAGMNQFKDFFLGNQVPDNRRIADTQKCLRVSGKHNDLEEVGRDGTHHTMFEMLGNWSIGDYFKKEAIEWSWELLTKVYGLPADRLYATVFEGDDSENLEPDDEARGFWKTWLPESHILNGNKKDNFWEMGDQGPCGPCSEIHIDMRSDEERAKLDGAELVNKDHPMVVEIWNNVFIQFNRKADGSLEDLPEKHVDTGMGFERLTMVLQGKTYTYDTDIFTPIIKYVEKVSGIKYTGRYPDDPAARPPADMMSDIAMRVVADHIRAVTFTVADGQLPGNTGAGYVIRRILRRAVRYYYSFLNIKEPFLYTLIPMLGDMFEDVFPEVKAQEEYISNIILSEEKLFLNTLENGLKRLDELMYPSNERSFSKVLSNYLKTKNIPFQHGYQVTNQPIKVDFYFPKDKVILDLKLNPKQKMYKVFFKDFKEVVFDLGRFKKNPNYRTGIQFIDQFIELKEIDRYSAFELYDTFGFPIDLTNLIATENGWHVDENGFKEELEIQRQRAKADAAKDTGDWHRLEDGQVEFVGYDDLIVSKAKILRHRTVISKKSKRYEVVLNKTPFYAESGGQHGDKGWLTIGGEHIKVIDTQKENDLIIHIIDKLPPDLSGTVEAKVDSEIRQSTSRNHSAVHLMHAALHRIIGPNAIQKGQDVDDKRLRFDFSHFQKVTDEELRSIEQMVNEKILQNIKLKEDREVPLEEAKKSGAMMLFSEKYGDIVRVITFDEDFSMELCGGTHVQATGNIGGFRILSETGVAAGIRRIEAVTGKNEFEYVSSVIDQLDKFRKVSKNNLPPDISYLKNEEKIKNLEKQIEEMHAAQASNLKNDLKTQVQQLKGVNFIAKKLPLQDANAIKNLAYQLEHDLGDAVIVFAADLNGKAHITMAVSGSLVEEKKYHAGDMVKQLAKEIKGGGGGQPFFATAGGKDVSGLDRVVEKAKELV